MASRADAIRVALIPRAQALRPESAILMGKNTCLRKIIRDYCESKGDNSWMVSLL